VQPPGPAAAQIFFLERWYFASDVIRSSRGSPTDAELAPMTARQAAASEAVDWLRETVNIRASECVGLLAVGVRHRTPPETTNRAADDLGSMEFCSSRLAVARETPRTNER